MYKVWVALTHKSDSDLKLQIKPFVWDYYSDYCAESVSWLRNRTASSLHLRESRQISDFRFQILVLGLPTRGKFQISDFRATWAGQILDTLGCRFQISDFRACTHDVCRFQISDFRFYFLIWMVNFVGRFQISDFRATWACQILDTCGCRFQISDL